MQRIFDLEFKLACTNYDPAIFITFKFSTLTQTMSAESADEAMSDHDEVQATASSHAEPSKQKVCLHVHMYIILSTISSHTL